MKYTITLIVFLLIASTIFNSLFSQTQMGDDIDAEEALELSGWSVSVSSDGNRIAIGSIIHDNQGTGHVRVYEWDEGSWTKMGVDIFGEPGFNNPVSVSLSSDGSRVAIGTPGTHGFGTEIGNVQVYEWDGGIWEQLGNNILGEANIDYSGSSVSLSSDGSRVAIGAPGNDGAEPGTGHVRVYEWDGVNWTQMGEDIDGEAEADHSGRSVSLSSDGSRVAIGAPGNDGAEPGTGHVRVYEWDGVNWTQMGEDIDGEAAADHSGSSISLSSDGSRVAIGAPGNDGTGSSSGHVRVYEWDGLNWAQMGDNIDGEAAADHSGRSVSLSSDGSRVAIGAPGNDGTGSNSGHVRIFEWYGGNWAQLGEDIDGEAEADNSGSSVSLSSDGSRVAIGAPGNNGTGAYAGHVRVYEFNPVSSTILEETSIEIIPNPASRIIELFGVENGTVRIIDQMGRFILGVETLGSAIDVSGLTPGIYFIQINSDNQWTTKKLIKK